MKPDPNRSGQDTVDDEDKFALSLGEVIGSVLAAGFGVQSSKNRERDFRRGSPSHYIVGGVIATIVFIVAVVFVVKLIVAYAA